MKKQTKSGIQFFDLFQIAAINQQQLPAIKGGENEEPVTLIGTEDVVDG